MGSDEFTSGYDSSSRNDSISSTSSSEAAANATHSGDTDDDFDEGTSRRNQNVFVATEKHHYLGNKQTIVRNNTDLETISPEESYPSMDSQILTIFKEIDGKYLKFINFELQTSMGFN